MEYFKKMLKGYGIPRPPPPPPLNGASLFGDLLKRKKNPRGVVSVEEEGKSFISPFCFVKLPFCLERLLQSFFGG